MVFEGPFGYFNGFCLPHGSAKSCGEPGSALACGPWHELYAVHTNHQQIVDTLVSFKVEHPAFKAEDLRRVIVRGPESTMELRHALLQRTTVMGGKYSTPFTTAVALFRDISDPLSFDESAIRDSKIRDLAKWVQLVTTNDAGDRANGGDCEITLEWLVGSGMFFLRGR
jgi:2-methylcitrate dehydratase PrpD